MTTCSELTRTLDVDPAGTASTIRSWLLLEQPGPWSGQVREHAFHSALGDGGWSRLERLWPAAQLRPLVVRRPGRAGRVLSSDRTLLVGSVAAGRGWLERLPARALPSLDLEALAAGEPGHGEPVDGPLFAVCTNGSVDRCCAVLGRPLVTALAAAHPDRTWEVSHVGGCRFAANLLVLPAATMHGRLTPADGLQVAAAALRGEVASQGLRGRTGTSAFAGTAEVALRRHLGLTGLDDVQLVAEEPLTSESTGADVLLRARGDVWRVVVRERDLGVHTSVCDGSERLTTTTATSVTVASLSPT